MSRIPWIDIFSLAVFIRIIYVALSHGALNEFVKFTGVFIASFLSLQYYSSFLKPVFSKAPFFFNALWLDMVSFFIIFLASVFVFFAAGKAVAFIFKREKYSLWEKAAALIMGVLRAILLISVLVFSLYFVPPVRAGIRQSVSFKAVKDIAPAVYIAVFKIYKRMNPQASFNEDVKNHYEPANAS